LDLTVAALAAACLLMVVPSALAQPAAVPPRPGIEVSVNELQALPEAGPAWDRLKAVADHQLPKADLADQENQHDTAVLALALVYARTGVASYRRRAANGITAAIGTERGGRTLALGRGLVAYVLAADLIDFAHYDAVREQRFRTWLSAVRTKRLGNVSHPTLISTHEVRANNWGTIAGGSRIAADVYLGDRVDLDRAATVFRGWLGDRSAYAGFEYDDTSWQSNPDLPVGINPAGSTKDGYDVGGALPEEMRRGCGFRFPPCPTAYAWETMQGAVLQAELLRRQGYDAFAWQDRALLRAARFLMWLDAMYPETAVWDPGLGDDAWVPWVLNARYGTDLWTPPVVREGKGFGYTDWLFSTYQGPPPLPIAPMRPSDAPQDPPPAPPAPAVAPPPAVSGAELPTPHATRRPAKAKPRSKPKSAARGRKRRVAPKRGKTVTKHVKRHATARRPRARRPRVRRRAPASVPRLVGWPYGWESGLLTGSITPPGGAANP
jgi:hypothetical protein